MPTFYYLVVIQVYSPLFKILWTLLLLFQDYVRLGVIWVCSNCKQTRGDKEVICIWSQSSGWPRVKLETVGSFLPDVKELFDKECDFM